MNQLAATKLVNIVQVSNKFYKYLLILPIVCFNIGVLKAQDLTMVFLNTNDKKEHISKAAIDSLQKGHLANIKKMARESKLLVAGPFDGGGGIFILNTASVRQAQKWISTDPAIAANRYKIDIFPWIPQEGGACLAEENAEFVSYNFIRYNSYITKYNVQDAPYLFKAHDDYVDQLIGTGNVISSGIFSNSDGATLVIKGELDDEVIMKDPTVIQGFLLPVIKKIWVAKGSFCE